MKEIIRVRVQYASSSSAVRPTNGLYLYLLLIIWYGIVFNFLYH